MRKIASEVLIERLADWGVDTIFGLPGDGINGIMEGLRRHQDHIRFVLVHHEEAAAFMATGYAKSTGRLGVCLATSGPGAIHLLNGLYDAKLDHAPVLAITGMQETQMLGTGYQQEVALEKLFIDVAEYNEMIHVPAQLPTLVDIAIRHALTRRGVAHLTIPTDIQIADAGANPWSAPAPAVNQADGARSSCRPPACPAKRTSRRRPRCSMPGPRWSCSSVPAPWGARRGARRRQNALASPIVKTLPGKAVVPDDHPLDRGWYRAARHRPGHRRHGGLRHPVHGRDQLPLHEVPARTGPVQGRADRGRSRSGPATASPPTCPMIGDAAARPSRALAATRRGD